MGKMNERLWSGGRTRTHIHTHTHSLPLSFSLTHSLYVSPPSFVCRCQSGSRAARFRRASQTREGLCLYLFSVSVSPSSRRCASASRARPAVLWRESLPPSPENNSNETKRKEGESRATAASSYFREAPNHCERNSRDKVAQTLSPTEGGGGGGRRRRGRPAAPQHTHTRIHTHTRRIWVLTAVVQFVSTPFLIMLWFIHNWTFGHN